MNEGEEHPQWHTTTKIYRGDSTLTGYKVIFKTSSGVSALLFPCSKKAKIDE